MLRATSCTPRSPWPVDAPARRSPGMPKIDQIQLRYIPDQDRLLLRLNTSDRQEMRLWFTRRLVSRIWPQLVRLLAAEGSVASQPHPEARAAVLAFRHQAVAAQADYSKPFRDDAAVTPLGPEPLLVTRVQLRPVDAGGIVLNLRPARGQGVELNLDLGMLHALCELMSRTVAGAEWDMQLKMGTDPAIGGEPSSRLN